MGNRPFRFGLNVGTSKGRDDFLSAVRRAEAAGYSTIVSPDHIGPRLAVLPLLATAAEIAPAMRVSPMVIANDYRHPAALAKEAATIDILSGGRFELGLGTGWIADQYQAAGMAYDPPGVRVDRLEEAITVIKGLWGGKPFSYSGDHYQLNKLVGPRPIQRPHPPLLIAGGGPRMLRLAGRQANIISINPLKPGGRSFDTFDADTAEFGARIEAQLGWIKDGAGERFDEIELSVMIHHIAVKATSDAVVNDLAARTGAMPSQIRLSPNVLVGSAEEIKDTLLERRERYGLSYFVIGAHHLEAMQPVIAQLAGV